MAPEPATGSSAPAVTSADSRGRRSTGKMIRDGLLVVVILAMALPFVVAAIGGPDLSEGQKEQATAARQSAYREQDWLGNSMSHKVVAAEAGAGGSLRVRERYYTFFGLPWGWSEATVEADGSVTVLRTGLSVQGSF